MVSFCGKYPGWISGRTSGLIRCEWKTRWGSSPGRQQPPSADAGRKPRKDRGTPAHHTSAGPGSRRVARLEHDQPEFVLIEDRGDPAVLLRVEECVDVQVKLWSRE